MRVPHGCHASLPRITQAQEHKGYAAALACMLAHSCQAGRTPARASVACHSYPQKAHTYLPVIGASPRRAPAAQTATPPAARAASSQLPHRPEGGGQDRQRAVSSARRAACQICALPGLGPPLAVLPCSCRPLSQYLTPSGLWPVACGLAHPAASAANTSAHSRCLPWRGPQPVSYTLHTCMHRAPSFICLLISGPARPTHACTHGAMHAARQVHACRHWRRQSSILKHACAHSLPAPACLCAYCSSASCCAPTKVSRCARSRAAHATSGAATARPAHRQRSAGTYACTHAYNTQR